MFTTPPGFGCKSNSAEGHEDEPVIGIITRFTDSRVVVALLHPVEGEVYRTAKNIEQVFDSVRSA